MDTESFVASLKKHLIPGVVTTCRKILADPNKLEMPTVIECSNWFKGLSPDDQMRVIQVAGIAAERSVFAMLVAIDNCNRIDDEETRGDFELHYVKTDQRVRLGDPPDFLHDHL